MSRLHARVRALLFPGQRPGRWARRIDFVLAGLVVVSLASIAIETVEPVRERFGTALQALDAATAVVFTIEYAARLWACVDVPGGRDALRARLRWARSPAALVDLLALLPTLLEALLPAAFDLRALRVLRLVRLFRVGRNASSLVTLVTVVRRESGILVASGYVMTLLVVLTGCLGWLAEHDAQPQAFADIPSALYWAAMTLSSIGYGDIAPVTPVGRALTVVMSFVGIGLFAFPAGVLAAGFGDQLRLDREAFGQLVAERVAADPRGGPIRRALEQALLGEAERLHVDPAEVGALVAAARHARARDRVGLRQRRRLQRERAQADTGLAGAAMAAVRGSAAVSAGIAVAMSPGRGPAGRSGGDASQVSLPVDAGDLAGRPELAFALAHLRIRELVRLAVACGAAGTAEADDPVSRRFADAEGRVDPVEREVWRSVRRAARR